MSKASALAYIQEAMNRLGWPKEESLVRQALKEAKAEIEEIQVFEFAIEPKKIDFPEDEISEENKPIIDCFSRLVAAAKHDEIQYALDYEQERINECAKELRYHERVRDILKEMRDARR